MPQRRSHTKSRRGCLQCKQRHVKCDEATPSCGYCIKREVACSFITPSHNNSRSVSASPFDASDYLNLPSPSPSRTRTSELRFMLNWSTKTFRTLQQHSDESHLWQIVVPELALSHDYLMDALLAVSARHLSINDPTNASLWDCAALDYENKALEGFQLILPSLDSTNYEPIFACSVLIMVFSMTQSHSEPKSHPSDPVIDVLELRQFLIGIAIVQNDYHDLLRLSSFGALFTPHTPGKTGYGDSPGIPTMDMCSTLETLRSEASETSNSKPYSDGISGLQQAMEAYTEGGLFSGIMAWPSGLNEDMVRLIEIKEPLALAMLGHYGVIIHMLRDRWWARDTGKRLVQAILPTLRASRGDWADLVQNAWSAVTDDRSSHNTPSSTLQA
ncbi:hypothetical protein D6C86_07028 [Aureobasidium pullulans]|uniref:Zn(2)-C6 fungal-type domain-containing protein n=1 Tax=Aureobasidium pullulans TaxID=5580 RepID=A0A4S9VZJ9_AURPU|nr:hypothetical protein D6D29_08490 [Aureobasidium pullulans]THW44384.1 hypothetical protein D6D22_04018 [Aureobasidium pullulans]THY71505.1 hypothetical protein D6C94_07640 [Aureobasidium pullulans]THZ41065.1 hypothetical protein D6C87_06000 [Aureobasidium pullulans]THZ57566.1 hypothetical protein D6C86_07028 [Aureobasidium pullulans]